jgi:hypothetical protein
MSEKNPKKLTLRKESVGRLDQDDLEKVAGGASGDTCNCSSSPRPQMQPQPGPASPIVTEPL